MPLLSEVHPEGALYTVPKRLHVRNRRSVGIAHLLRPKLTPEGRPGGQGRFFLSRAGRTLAKALRAARWLIPRTHVWRNREAAVSGAKEPGQGREGEPVIPALGPSARTGGASAPRPPGSLSAAAVSPRQAGKAACLNPSAAPALLSAPESSILPSPPAWLA